MEGTQTNQRVKARRAIKDEPEDEEIHAITPRKRRNKEQGTITASQGNSESETRDTRTGGDGGRLRVNEQEEELEALMEKKQTKTESDEEWSEEEEDGDSDPDYDDDGCYDDDSGSELSKQHSANMNRNTGDGELSWEFRSTPDTPPDSLRFKPARTPGPVLDHTASWTPLSVFQLFYSSSVIRTIVENTNKNGKKQRIEAGRKNRWTDITLKDFYIYLSTVMYMSLVKLYEHSDYWSKNSLYNLQFPRNAMTRLFFKSIKSALCMCDPEKDEKNESKETAEYDKLFKVKPFYTELVNACKTHFQPYRNICVHERKVRKDKPLKCGFRVYALADSSTGYTWNFLINTGKSAGYTAVKNLLPLSTLGSGYTLYTDGPFSSPRLFTELLDKNIGCCGILSPCHSGFPQNAQNDFTAPQASRGDIRWLRKDKLLFVKWMDTREVAMCSTVHEAFTGQVIKRPVRQGKGWVPKQFSCPDAVADFNRRMIVPRNFDFDFNMPCSRIEWSRIIFYHLLDLAVVNSFILYKELLKLKGVAEAKDLKQKEFREELCREMYKFAKGCDPDDSAPASPPAASVLCIPVFFEESNGTDGRKRCKVCQKKTRIYCQKCLVALCLVSNHNCFKEWHELEFED